LPQSASAINDGRVLAARLLDHVRRFVDAEVVPGAVVGVLHDGQTTFAAAGVPAVGAAQPLRVDAPVRISSNTKPLTAALTVALADDGVLDLHDPVERFVPELADRRVLRRLDGDASDTVPATREVTIDDLLTMRLGFGFVFESPCPVAERAAQAGLGLGPPDPSTPLTPDQWVTRFAEFPLLEQPGSVWRYDMAFAVLGVVLARAAGQPLDDLMRERLLEPLGMRATGFVAPPGQLPTCYAAGESGLTVFDEAANGRWTRRPAFPDARGGLVSTAADLLRFAEELLDTQGGVVEPRSATAMTSDHLSAEQRAHAPAQSFLRGAGWGYGLEVTSEEQLRAGAIRRYGWGGGLGTLWYTWPDHRCSVVLLTQVTPPSAPMFDAFIEAAESQVLSSLPHG
jgi:CubicO group peptidase (beta-lactamase class C family)